MQDSAQRPARLFGMVTTSASRHYTPLALRSFLAHTPLGDRDHFVLIDNDADFELPAGIPSDRITLVRSEAPQGFARNGNFLLREARAREADLFFLNNDLVFTTGWLEPLVTDRRALLSPLSNEQVGGSAGGFGTQVCMDLEDYTGHEAGVEAIAAQVRASAEGYQVTPSVAFFCIKIPRSVYETVGDFDEAFGKGGGEDRDYAVRAWIAGIPQEFALQSYVLHFQGRSTWRGGESPEEQQQRNAQYTQAFQKKWGPALTYAFLGKDWNLFRSDPVIARTLEAQDYSSVVRRLKSRPSLDPFIKRQRNARIAAVCCIYDDDGWLAPTIESAYDACDSIWFLIGERPWNGPATDQAPLIARINVLPDPARKIRIVRGDWPDEATQRNAGLEMLAAAGIDYCFVLDADEIYDPAQLAGAFALVRENPQIDCWSVSWFTYWKSYRYRVDPVEPFTPVVIVRVGTGSFTEARGYQAPQTAVLPSDVVMCHHMSYARTDEQIHRKITTFSHAGQIVPEWYDNVWRRWDTDRTIENVHPCWPAAFRRIVEQPYDTAPAIVRRRWDEDERRAS
jgi:GT2 family glycosyltransferase